MTNQDLILRQIFEQTKTIALVGYSLKPERASNEVAHYLSRLGFRVIGVNPGHVGLTAFGQPIVAQLTDIGEPVDMVDVFRRPEDTPDIARQAVAIGARTLWRQLGVINDEAKRIGEQGGLQVVMDRCPKIEWPRLGLSRKSVK